MRSEWIVVEKMYSTTQQSVLRTTKMKLDPTVVSDLLLQHLEADAILHSASCFHVSSSSMVYVCISSQELIFISS